ncbi:MAG TPA: hypothetical protein VK509_18290 [Polyangiales bacterium]|nr:hypothetical protein [Polyangiales bacterium]
MASARAPVKVWLATCRLALVALALVASAIGCGDDTHALDFQIGFASSELAARAERLEARILLGGCDGDDALYTSSFAADEMGELPKELGSGRFGFAARALDDGCRWYAAGCRELALPRNGDARTLVMLEAMATPAVDCDAEGCDERACRAPAMDDAMVPIEAGRPDTGVQPPPPVDSGARDAQPPDATPPVDAGPPVMIELEAEAGDPLRAPLMRISDAMVSGGEYITYPWTSEQTLDQRNMLKRNLPPADDDADGIAVYQFEITVPGEYRLWGRVQPPTLEEDSFWVQIDDQPWLQWNDISHETPWHWDDVRPFETRLARFLIPFEAGPHRIVLSYRELGARLDKFLLTNDLDFIPSG